MKNMMSQYYTINLHLFWVDLVQTRASNAVSPYSVDVELYNIVPPKKSPKYVILDYYTFSYILLCKSF